MTQFAYVSQSADFLPSSVSSQTREFLLVSRFSIHHQARTTTAEDQARTTNETKKTERVIKEDEEEGHSL